MEDDFFYKKLIFECPFGSLSEAILKKMLLLAISSQVMMGYILQVCYGAYLPFSQPFNGSGGDAASIAKGFIALFVIGILGLCHWLVLEKVWLMIFIACIAMLLSWQMNKRISQTRWKHISFAKR